MEQKSTEIVDQDFMSFLFENIIFIRKSHANGASTVVGKCELVVSTPRLPSAPSTCSDHSENRTLGFCPLIEDLNSFP